MLTPTKERQIHLNYNTTQPTDNFLVYHSLQIAKDLKSLAKKRSFTKGEVEGGAGYK